MSLYKELEIAVEDAGMTKTEFILRAIREKLKNYKIESEKADAEPVTRAEIKKLVQDTIQEELAKAAPIISLKKEECKIQR